jgi:hypothetical protein
MLQTTLFLRAVLLFASMVPGMKESLQNDNDTYGMPDVQMHYMFKFTPARSEEGSPTPCTIAIDAKPVNGTIYEGSNLVDVSLSFLAAPSYRSSKLTLSKRCALLCSPTHLVLPKRQSTVEGNNLFFDVGEFHCLRLPSGDSLRVEEEDVLTVFRSVQFFTMATLPLGLILALSATSVYVGADDGKRAPKYKLKRRKKRAHEDDKPLVMIENPLHYYFKTPMKGGRSGKKRNLLRSSGGPVWTPKSAWKSPKVKKRVAAKTVLPDDSTLDSDGEWQAWLQEHVYE